MGIRIEYRPGSDGRELAKFRTGNNRGDADEFVTNIEIRNAIQKSGFGPGKLLGHFEGWSSAEVFHWSEYYPFSTHHSGAFENKGIAQLLELRFLQYLLRTKPGLKYFHHSVASNYRSHQLFSREPFMRRRSRAFTSGVRRNIRDSIRALKQKIGEDVARRRPLPKHLESSGLLARRQAKYHLIHHTRAARVAAHIKRSSRPSRRGVH